MSIAHMFKGNKLKTSKKANKSFSKYHNETTLSSFPSKSLTSLLNSPAQTKKSPKSNWNWSTPQLNRKAFFESNIYERRKSSEWTKLRNTLEFIKKSRETLNLPDEEIDENSEKGIQSRNNTSLTFLGQLYDLEIATDEESGGSSGQEDVFDEIFCKTPL